jgi:hypothetical protein
MDLGAVRAGLVLMAAAFGTGGGLLVGLHLDWDSLGIASSALLGGAGVILFVDFCVGEMIERTS